MLIVAFSRKEMMHLPGPYMRVFQEKSRGWVISDQTVQMHALHVEGVRMAPMLFGFAVSDGLAAQLSIGSVRWLVVIASTA